MEEEIKPNYTRVTEPLSVYSKFDEIDPTVLANACARGTKVHTYCEMHAKDDYYPTPDDDIKPYLDSFIGWYDEVVDKVLYLELRLYDDLYRITGKMDMVAILKGDTEPTIIDYKTSQTTSKSWALQTAAYQYLFTKEEKTGSLYAKRRIALQLRKDGRKAKVHEYANHEEDWKLYRSALDLWRFFS